MKVPLGCYDWLSGEPAGIGCPAKDFILKAMDIRMLG